MVYLHNGKLRALFIFVAVAVAALFQPRDVAAQTVQAPATPATCVENNGQQEFACGSGSTAVNTAATAVGNTAIAGGGGTSVGVNAGGTGGIAVASGSNIFNVSFGQSAGNTVTGDQNTAVGTLAGGGVVGTNNAAAGFGAGVLVTGSNNSAFGPNAGGSITGSGNTAVGFNASTAGIGAPAVSFSTAVGANTQAFANNSIAIGGNTASGAGNAAFVDAAAVNGIAIGNASQVGAAGLNAMALGNATSANFANSAAIGNGATVTRANQQVFGTATNTYTMSGITSAASRAAQSGPTQIVTADTAGNLATTTLGALGVASTADLNAINTQLASLQTEIDTNLREARAGTALALAASGLHYDMRPGKLSVAAAYGNFKGMSGLAAGLGYAINERVRVNGSFTASPDVNAYGGVVGASFTLN